jgi:hypothetical protein
MSNSPLHSLVYHPTILTLAHTLTLHAGTTVGSIRNRISALRVKQRNLYEEMGWEVPEGGAGQSVKKKRGAEGTEEDGKKAKAPRARKGKKVEEVKSAEGEGESEGEIGGGVGVKEEQVEADFV